jgi:DNA-binding PadR family transcriptional regulator
MGHGLGELEQLVLLAVLRLEDDAYGIAIQQEIAAHADRYPSLGAVYSTLTRLEQKGYVSGRAGEPTPTRGGRRKKLYAVEAAGRRALQGSLSAIKALSQGLATVLKQS